MVHNDCKEATVLAQEANLCAQVHCNANILQDLFAVGSCFVCSVQRQNDISCFLSVSSPVKQGTPLAHSCPVLHNCLVQHYVCYAPFFHLSSAFVVRVTCVATWLTATFTGSSSSFVAFDSLSCSADYFVQVSKLCLHTDHCSRLSPDNVRSTMASWPGRRPLQQLSTAATSALQAALQRR